MELLEGTAAPPNAQAHDASLTEATASQLLSGLWSVIHAVKRHLGPALLREHGLEFKDFLALDTIGGGTNYPSLMCQRLNLTPSNGSRLIEDLVGSGLIERRLDAQDARRVQLILTTRGQEVLAATSQTLLKLLKGSLGDLSDTQVATFVQTLETLSTALGSPTPPQEIAP
ncbi:MarR family winged helix-turn-helix transcriptional regulator [Deinococcus sp.]|uniref:MarR family winged helix-turn-helix transcriptional regulator n=1 Tax=Deinococcus sp. TaxID=47478 RepID=UPI003CC620AF